MNLEETTPNERLKRARHQRGWTQAELAEKVGTTFETVSRWERGIKAPSAYFQKKLCDVFSKTPEELGLLANSSTSLGPVSSPCVFFSSAYADAERKFVVLVKSELQLRGVTVWSSRMIRRQEAGNKRNVLQEAIRASQAVLLIVSPATYTSHHVHDTLRLAKHFGCPVCAVWIDGDDLQGCMPNNYSRPYATIDAREGDEQDLCSKIVEALEQRWLTSSLPETSEVSEPMWRVPAILLPLVGREEELASLSKVLLRPQNRLVTLIGTGGIGKTHLALHAAMELREYFADGVCFVSLAAISDFRLVFLTIAEVLEIRQAGERSLLEQVKDALRNKHLLLILDNFEQVQKVSPQLLEILAVSLNLKILVTSRFRLHIHGEYEFPVSSLALPDAALSPESGALSRCAAVSLFLQRAQAAKSDFRLTPANARFVADICIRLDGLPLAIELAAARIRSLSSEALLARLENRLQILVSREQDVDERQRTMRNTIAWSYDLLDTEEQQLFRWLSVFVGSWNLESAEAVCNALGSGSVYVWDGVESLLDKSLVQSAEQEGEGRVRILETIREYGLECLKANGEVKATQLAHAEHYLRLAEEAEPHLKGEQQATWLMRLEQEQENIRAALIWLMQYKQAEAALRFCGALWRFWHLRGYWREGRRWLEAVLELTQAGRPTVARARVLLAAGDMAYYQDDYLISHSLLEECIAICRTLGAEKELAMALGILGVLMQMQGKLTIASPLLKESETLCRMLNSQWELSYLLRRLAEQAAQAGELKQAVEYAQESLTLAQKMGDKSLIATVLSTSGGIVARQGDLEQAIAYNQESLTLARELGDKLLIALSLNNLGYFTALKGGQALTTYILEGLTLMRELGDRMYINKSLNNLGYVTLHQGKLAQAKKWYYEALSLSQEIQSEINIGENLFGLALIAAAEEQFLQAARLLGAVEVRLDVNVDMNPAELAEYKHAVESVRAQLGRKAFVAARNEGRTMSVEQVLAASHSPASVTSPPSPKYPDGLTEREVQVLCLAAKGLTDEQIAKQLVIAPRTVNTHLTSIYRKIQVSSVGKERQIGPRIAAARYATEHDLC